MNKSLKQLDELFDYDYMDALSMTYEPVLDREVKVHAPVLINQSVREDKEAFAGAITSEDIKFGLNSKYSLV